MVLNVGNMIFKLREEAGISQKELARGLFALADYSRIERGEKETDRMHLEALFQRMGKSADKLEMIISMEEYQQMYWQHQSLESLALGDYESAKMCIEKYASYLDLAKPLHLQSLLFLQAVKDYVKTRNESMLVSQLEKALELTFTEWKKNDFGKVFLCKQEIQLVLLLSYLGKMTDVLEELVWYIDEHYTDEEERAKVFPHCTLALGRLYLQRRDMGSALEVCKCGIENLSINGVLTPMKELLAIAAQCYEQLENLPEKNKCCKQMAAIDFLYEMGNVQYPTEPLALFLLTSLQGEVVVSNELIKELRQAKHMSQEALCEGICTRETLSRIEGGIRSPNKKNFYAMLKRLGVERETYYGFIVSDDYALYEMVRKYKRREGRGEKVKEEANEILSKLENGLNKKYVLNRQFLESAFVSREIKEEEKPEIGLQRLSEILNYSMKQFAGTVYRIPFRQEVQILIKMTFYLRSENKYEEALDIYKQILERFHNSMVHEMFHAVSGFLVYLDYAEFLETLDRLNDSEKIAKEGIQLALACQRGDVAGKILMNLSCVFEKRKDTLMEKRCLENSYYLLERYNLQEYQDILQKVYERKYEVNLNS